MDIGGKAVRGLLSLRATQHDQKEVMIPDT